MRLSGTFILLTVCTLGAAPRATTLPAWPIRFEVNRGQAPAEWQFVGRASGDEMRFARGRSEVIRHDALGHAGRVTMTFAGSNTAAAPEGTEPASAATNYLKGPSGDWIRDVPAFNRVRYRGLYPGIDLVFYGQNGRLEYDYTVAPGASASVIRMCLDGADRLYVDGSGDLVIETAAGEVRWKRPDVYQEDGGARRTVDAAFVLRGREVGFRIGAYDRSRPLVIDPVLLAYSSYFGGRGNEAARSVAVDSAGNIVIAGFTTSDNLSKTGGTFQPAYGGAIVTHEDAGDAFVAKFNSAGALQWVTYLGGNADDIALGVATDASNNIFVTGYTNSTNFTTTPGAYQGTFKGQGRDSMYHEGGDAFLVKLDPTGKTALFSTFMGGSRDDRGIAIAMDGEGNAYIAGNTISTDFPTTLNAYQRTYKGGSSTDIVSGGDAFVAKFSNTGALVFSTLLGGSNSDTPSAIAVDKSGNVYIAGGTRSRDFPTTPGAVQTTYGGEANTNDQPIFTLGDAFLTKLDATGTKLVYSTYLGGSRDDLAMGLAIDAAGAAYVTGMTSSSNFPGVTGKYAGPAALDSKTRYFLYGDAFAAKVNPAGTALQYSTYLGGADDDGGWGIVVDSAGNAFVAGSTNSADFKVTADALQSKFGGTGGQTSPTGDVFLAALDPTGKLTYATYFGGSADDGAGGLALDPAGNLILTGSTVSTNFKTGSDAAQASFAGQSTVGLINGDAFLMKVSGLVTAGPASLKLVSGDKQSAAPNQPLPQPLVVQVLSAGNTGVAGVPVTFSATNATVKTATVNSDTSGLAGAQVTLGGTPGPVTITATAAGLAAVTFSATVTAPPPPDPVIVSLTNAYNPQQGAAPGGLVTVEFSNLEVTAAQASGTPLSTGLGSATLLVNGTAVPLASVAAGTLQAQIPFETPVGSATAVLRGASTASAPFAFNVSEADPAILAGADGHAIAANSDGSPNTPDNPAAAGSTVTISVTGQGLVDPPAPTGDVPGADAQSVPILPVTATVEGQDAAVSAALQAGVVGVLQVQVTIPPADPGDQPLVLLVGGHPSAAALVSVAGN